MAADRVRSSNRLPALGAGAGERLSAEHREHRGCDLNGPLDEMPIRAGDALKFRRVHATKVQNNGGESFSMENEVGGLLGHIARTAVPPGSL